MSFATTLFPEALRSIDSGNFDGTYMALGTPLGHQACLIKFTNLSDVDVTVSWDGGTTDHDLVPANGFALYDVTQQTQRESGIYVAKGTPFYVKGSQGTGLVYLTALYPVEG